MQSLSLPSRTIVPEPRTILVEVREEAVHLATPYYVASPESLDPAEMTAADMQTTPGLDRLLASKQRSEDAAEAKRIEEQNALTHKREEPFIAGKKWALDEADYDELRNLASNSGIGLRFGFERLFGEPSSAHTPRFQHVDKDAFQQGAAEVFKQLERAAAK